MKIRLTPSWTINKTWSNDRRDPPSLLINGLNEPALLDSLHDRRVDDQIRIGLFPLAVLVARRDQNRSENTFPPILPSRNL
jgi:hypothetical protein